MMQSFGSSEIFLRAVVYIEDALAYRSLCHRTDPVSIQIYRAMQTSIYRVVYYSVSAILLLLAFVETPSSISASSDFTNSSSHMVRRELPFGVTHSIEILCILLFVFDFLARLKTADKSIWKTPWLLAYSIVNVLYMVFLCVFLGTKFTELRVYRVLRPFYLVQKSSIMKKMLNAIKKSMPEVFGVLIVLALNIFIFGLSAHIIFSDKIKSEDDDYFSSISTSIWNLLVLTTTANNPDVMIPAYSTNRLYIIFFVAFIWLGTYGLMNLLLAVIYNQFRQHFKVSVRDMVTRRGIALRAAFATLTSPQSDAVLSRPIDWSVSVSTSFGLEGGSHTDCPPAPIPYEEDEVLVINEEVAQPTAAGGSSTLANPRNYFVALSTVISLLDIVRLDRNYKKYLFKHLEECAQTDHFDREDFVKMFLDIETDYSEWERRQQPRFRSREIPRIKMIVTHYIFEMIGTVLAFVNTVALLVVLLQKPDPETGIRRGANVVLIMNIFVTVYYTFEQIMRLLGVGWRAYFRNFSFCFDLVITITLSVLMIFIYTRKMKKQGRDETAIAVLRSINLCICFRFVRVILQVKRLRVVVQTYLTLIRQMQVYLGFLVALTYIFALIGMELFSVDVTAKIHNRTAIKGNKSLADQCGTYWNLEYYSLNFDDFFSAIVTLFTLMVVNNWHVIVEAFTYARGEWWVSFYFISWWVLCVLIVLNVIIALILDAFIDRWERKEGVDQVGNFHINQFLEAEDRTRTVTESEVINALQRNKIIKAPFMSINSDNRDLPSAASVVEQKTFCAK